jgi:hypothetical protein
MATEAVGTPKLHKGQVVMVSCFNERGQVRNEFARKALPHYAKVGVLVSCRRDATRSLLVYGVKMDYGSMLQLTEDCMVPVKGSS